MAGVKVTICGVNTQELPLLSAKEKKELLLKIKAGDQTARERFIKGNLRLVLSIVGRFSNSNENVDDLFQIGCIGLIKSIDNFDVSQGVQFSTYAVPMITGEIKRYLRDNSAIRVSRSLKDMAYKALYTKEQLLKSRQKEPTISEIASEKSTTPSCISPVAPRNKPKRIIGHERAEPILAIGITAALILIGKYSSSYCIACPHSWAATPIAATDVELYTESDNLRTPSFGE